MKIIKTYEEFINESAVEDFINVNLNTDGGNALHGLYRYITEYEKRAKKSKNPKMMDEAKKAWLMYGKMERTIRDLRNNIF